MTVLLTKSITCRTHLCAFHSERQSNSSLWLSRNNYSLDRRHHVRTTYRKLILNGLTLLAIKIQCYKKKKTLSLLFIRRNDIVI